MTFKFLILNHILESLRFLLKHGAICFCVAWQSMPERNMLKKINSIALLRI